MYREAALRILSFFVSWMSSAPKLYGMLSGVIINPLILVRDQEYFWMVVIHIPPNFPKSAMRSLLGAASFRIENGATRNIFLIFHRKFDFSGDWYEPMIEYLLLKPHHRDARGPDLQGSSKDIAWGTAHHC